jgi:chorismate mutase / prephenate dehydratase
MNNITFLGPVGATFSHDAYTLLAKTYGAPSIDGGDSNQCLPAATNSEIIPLLLSHGGYGTIAMETLAEGRVAEPVESFIDLLKKVDPESCPFHIVGALKMKISFCLMAKNGVPRHTIGRVLAHPKALGACKGNIQRIGWLTHAVSSNGEAARLVAEDEQYAESAALGPLSAAQKYGLRVIENAFEDGVAITTFFLLAPRTQQVARGSHNRALIVFKLAHRPGALVHALLPFEKADLNLIQIHSVHTGNHSYDFAIEVEATESEIPRLEQALVEMKKVTSKSLHFGPFAVQKA